MTSPRPRWCLNCGCRTRRVEEELLTCIERIKNEVSHELSVVPVLPTRRSTRTRSRNFNIFQFNECEYTQIRTAAVGTRRCRKFSMQFHHDEDKEGYADY